MTAADHHVTADDLAALVQSDHPDVHLSTIYRTLEALERLGAVDRLNLGPGPAVYHLRDHAHHHFVCDACSTVIELADPLVAPLTAVLRDDHGIAAVSKLVVHGRCAECAPGPPHHR
jgi:Fe2+ or Zn2+ uptake regulation protein